MRSAQFHLHAEIEEKHWWFRARRRILSRLVRTLLPPSRQSLVLDVGCGTGANVAALSADYECLGLDASDEAVALAKALHPGLSFQVGNCPEDIGSRAERAGLFLMADVLEHVEDDFHFLSTWLAAATPGAQFLITVPADMSLWTAHDESFGHYRRYDAPRLAATWEGLPVTVRLLSSYNRRLYPLVKAVRWLNRAGGRTSGAAGTDFQTPPTWINRTLETIFAGEAGELCGALDKSARVPPPNGVSLIAILKREPGAIAPRRKPAEIRPDEIPARGDTAHA